MSWIFLAGLSAACRNEPAPRAEPRADESAAAPRAPAETSEPAAGAPLVVFLGDSLTAGLGLGEADAYPALVGAALTATGTSVRVVNAGVSGDTTAGGLRRVDWLLSQHPAVVVIALGANDGLRGLSVSEMESNLRAIVSRSKAAGARVLLCGMLLPPNYGPEYARSFGAVFPRVAQDEGAALLPFLLDGVAGRPELNQADGIHPNADGQRRIAEVVAPALARLLAGAPRS